MGFESHTIMDGKVHVYRRENSGFWQCAIYLSGRNHRQSTKQSNLALALEFARDWCLDRLAEDRLRRRGVSIGPAPAAEPALAAKSETPARRGEKTFREAADAFVAEFTILTQGERNPNYVAQKTSFLKRRLLPFFGDRPLSQVTAGLIQEYRVERLRPPPPAPPRPPRYKLRGRAKLLEPRVWTRPSRSTLHNEMVCLRQVLKSANRKGWLDALPDMSTPYKASGKVSHRAWFSPEEYKRLYAATRARAKHPKRERWRAQSEQLHDYVLFMVNTGLRPDECSRLQFRDVSVVVDAGERILEIEVRGKRGTGYCKSMPGAVTPFLRVRRRKDPRPEDLVFGEVQRELLNAVLNELGLKRDREGNLRTAYSLRHTYICLRLMEGADIYQVAKNCRTSVEMIEKFYAAHLKTTLDAAAINVRRPAAMARPPRRSTADA